MQSEFGVGRTHFFVRVKQRTFSMTLTTCPWARCSRPDFSMSSRICRLFEWSGEQAEVRPSFWEDEMVVLFSGRGGRRKHLFQRKGHPRGSWFSLSPADYWHFWRHFLGEGPLRGNRLGG